MPSMVSSDRIVFARMAASAILKLSQITTESLPGRWLGH
jgi:hypothetical protein